MPKALPGSLAHLDQRHADDLSTDQARTTHQDIWELVQRGLVYPSPDALFVTFFAAGKPITLSLLHRLMADLRQTIHQQFGSAHTSATLGVGFGRWRQLIQSTHQSEPLGMKWALPDQNNPSQSTVFTRPGTVFKDSAGGRCFLCSGKGLRCFLIVFEKNETFFFAAKKSSLRLPCSPMWSTASRLTLKRKGIFET